MSTTLLSTYVRNHTAATDEILEGGVDVGFFRVAPVFYPGETASSIRDVLVELMLTAPEGEFRRLTQDDFAKGLSYIDLGAWLGDQQTALRLIGLGAAVNLWRVVTPASINAPEELHSMLAGTGLLLTNGFYPDGDPAPLPVFTFEKVSGTEDDESGEVGYELSVTHDAVREV